MFTAVCKPHLALNLLKRNRKINKRSDNINFIHLFCKPVCKKTLTKNYLLKNIQLTLQSLFYAILESDV